MTQITEAIEQANAALSFLAGIDRSTLCDVDLVELMRSDEQLGRFSDTSRVLDAGEVADRSRYELAAEGLSMRLSERKPALFVEQMTRVSAAEVKRRIRIGLAVRPRQSLTGEILRPERPVVAEAMTAGLIGLDAAHAILFSLKQAANGSDATPANMEAAELELVKAATLDSADLVLDAGRLWRDALDPEGIEPRFEEVRERRMVTVGRERNGIRIYTIKADPKTAALLDAVFLDSMDTKVGPRFLSDEDRQGAAITIIEDNGELVETLVDPRSIEQKRVDILDGVLTAGLRATREGPTDLRTVGSVTAIISLNDLQSGTGFGIIEGIDEVIPASVIQELVCDTGFFPMVVGMQGQPLYQGPLVRYASRAQRRALVARDGDRCISPGCRCRAASTDAHHVVFFSHGGATDIDNLVLLCPAHHHALHQGAFELKMIDGMPHYRASIDTHDPRAWKNISRNRLALSTTR